MKKLLRSAVCLLLLCATVCMHTSCIAAARLMAISGKAPMPALSYELTDAVYDEFDALLREGERLALEGTDSAAIEKTWDELVELYHHVYTQAQIAYILYCADMEDEVLSEQYLESSEIQADLYDDYMQACKRIFDSESPYKAAFFSDWTEAEIGEMLAFSEEITILTQENDRLLVDFRELDPETQGSEVEEIYQSFVENNNRIAKEYEYENYYDYANERMYLREYTDLQRQALRGYVKTYLVPLLDDAWSSFEEGRDLLSEDQYYSLVDFLVGDYELVEGDYLSDYMDTYHSSAQSVMESLFQSENVLFTSHSNAFAGAFTAYLYDEERPFCYFGPDYHDILTVTHEMGHYYAAHYSDADAELSLDLAEVQSQANEWLLLAFLDEKMDEDVYRAVLAYQLYDTMSTIVISTIVDEFEEYVYEHAQQIEAEQVSYDDVMREICEDYGGLELLERELTDMLSYWKYVAIESPVYYLSYSVSAVASLDIYRRACSDFTSAQEIYCKLIEQVDPKLTFLDNLETVGVSDPFQNDVYLFLRETVLS